MTRRQITTAHAKLERAARTKVNIAIEIFCRKRGCHCITNGPGGTMFYQLIDSKVSRTQIDVEPPKTVLDLIEWYERMFGDIPQSICRNGEWG